MKEISTYALQCLIIAALIFVGLELRAVRTVIDRIEMPRTVSIDNNLALPLQVEIKREDRVTRQEECRSSVRAFTFT